MNRRSKAQVTVAARAAIAVTALSTTAAQTELVPTDGPNNNSYGTKLLQK
jgi:hypothetical protein